jgi:hypothetical protein
MTLLSVDVTKRIQQVSDKIFVFSVMRNERIRVESWIRHYSSIGIRHFYIIDNGSTDGTYEFLSNQPGVICEVSYDSYQGSNYGLDWLNKFRSIVGPDKWVLFADADELIVYEGWPDRPILELIDKSEAFACDAVHGFMLDMYPDGPFDLAPAKISKDLFSMAPCFDSDYQFMFLPQKPWAHKSNDIVSVIGGPRVRLLSNMKRECRVSWFDLFIRGQIDRILPWVPDILVPTVVRCFPRSMPALQKIPLTKGGSEFQYINAHRVNGGKYYKQNVILCHFKFLYDFASRVGTEVARKEHYRRGAEYIMYNDLIKKHGSLDFRYSGTQRFVSSEQLMKLGLIREMSFSKSLTNF